MSNADFTDHIKGVWDGMSDDEKKSSVKAGQAPSPNSPLEDLQREMSLKELHASTLGNRLLGAVADSQANIPMGVPKESPSVPRTTTKNRYVFRGS